MPNLLILMLAACTAAPVFAQASTESGGDLKSIVLKHLKTSEDFTLKVAEAMPEGDYDYKLTPEQMTFGGQLVHLCQGMLHYLAPTQAEKPADKKPASTKKSDVIEYIKASYETAIGEVSKMTDVDLEKSYKMGQRSQSGMELILGMLVYTAHHRGSAEMYLRAKGIKPPAFQF